MALDQIADLAVRRARVPGSALARKKLLTILLDIF
jgi:hypothetical protein